ncbi:MULTISPECIES: homocysteine S-methyltransferase family protein [Olivibacter]|uniref:Homocysteine S-methyltransferase family protein n=2 Tax=Olivibacter TaxID=376469 RepID=A0ABV6HM26_9SPHI|nr:MULTISPECIES: homocysteine S-methyltransferase family protein [Olivibacter]MCL4638281.1 homocysteine S-methyltransferase family protein [Olivibacter sp. UJ_SKK_5.1]MDM8176072.1 homocysteine S-methyltransferase family protein [Olivibacter sp. 47]MDX3915698.1 homocysteine S-methyltransferase family protein [Pseudosphingobacterium sp.]QEL02698.1 homocysteine S-methyltransferase [Olivibacter sp. LS-1]
MATVNTVLPNGTSNLYLTDGGLETTLVFLLGHELPCFAAFDLLKDEKGYHALRDYYKRYLNISKDFGMGFILESPTWRANPDWMERVGYPGSAIVDVNEKAVQLLNDLKKEFENDIDNIVLSGCVGPRGDGYVPEHKMTAEEAQKYHARQIVVFSQTPVDMVSAITMNYVEEAIGIARASAAVGLPTVVSFTVETDGKLPTGMSLKEAINQVDKNVSQPPLYFMINCAHPSHFFNELESGRNEYWTKRIRGLRANASCKSHAELDEATELDRGSPQNLAIEHKKLKAAFSQLNVFGGCCGTDEEHIIAIAREVKASS